MHALIGISLLFYFVLCVIGAGVARFINSIIIIIIGVSIKSIYPNSFSWHIPSSDRDRLCVGLFRRTSILHHNHYLTQSLQSKPVHKPRQKHFQINISQCGS